MMSVMIASVAVIIGLDIYMAVNGVPGDTFSELVLVAAKKSLFLQASLGIIIGHLLWPTSQYRPPGWATVLFLVLTGIMWLGFDIHYWARDNPGNFAVLRKLPIILFSVYIIAGRFIWPQKVLDAL